MMIGAAILSVLMGLLLGLFGGGGSMLSVAILLYVLDMAPKEALATSTLVVGVTSLACTLQHARRGHVRFDSGVVFGLFTMAGAYGGGLLAEYIPGWILITLLGGMMVISGVSMIRGKARREPSVTAPARTAALLGIGVGVLTGLLGMGGGFMIVPALVLFGGLDVKSAVGTSTLIIAMKSVAAFLGYASHVPVDYGVAGTFVACAVAGTLVGTALVARFDPSKIKKAFGVFVLLMAVMVLYHQAGPEIRDALSIERRSFWVGGAGVSSCVLLLLFALSRGTDKLRSAAK